MQIRNLFTAGVLAMALAGCQSGERSDNREARKLLDPSNMDTTIKPGDNFFLYANGTRLKKDTIPADQTRWGSFDELRENNYKVLHDLLDSIANIKEVKPGSREQKVADFYRSGMDSVAINQAGTAPLGNILHRIAAMNTTRDVLMEVALEHTEGLSPLFGFYVAPDDKEATREISQFFQGGLGMPDRDYYFEKDQRTTQIRDAYKIFQARLFMLMGDDSSTARRHAAEVYKLEESLAAASLTRVERRNRYKVYNKISVADLNKVAPGTDWQMLLDVLGVAGEDSVLIRSTAFYKEMGRQLNNTPVEVWKKYLVFHLVKDMAPYLPDNFNEAAFAFYGRTVRGQQQQPPRWKRVLKEIDGSIGELLGQLYVDKYFRPEARERMLELVSNLQQSYAERIQQLDWMGDETKKKALAKLNSFTRKIGYPDKWKDYSKLTIQPDSYAQNVLAAWKWAYDHNLSKLGKPVDKTEWEMTPPTVNAYYNPLFNEIVFPAGILQFPFYDPEADDAVNYGGIGAVIGHEMTHGFDDQGRLYNADGNLHNWWMPEDSAHFVQKADIVVNQFNRMIVIDTMHANGRLTEGENLADLGGLNIAYAAFKKTAQGKSSEKIDGFTPDQRFFLSWAQIWRANTRPEELAARLKTDPHANSELRCNMPLSNMTAWYEAFNIPDTASMYRSPEERARVW